MDQTRHANGCDSRNNAPHYDPVHAASSDSSAQHPSLLPHAPAQQAYLASGQLGTIGSASAERHRDHGRLPPLRSSLGSFSQGAAGEALWNQRERRLPPNPPLPSPRQMTSMRLLGELGHAEQNLALQASATSVTEPPGATSGSHSPTNFSATAALFDPGFNPLFTRPPGSFRTATSQSSSSSILPNPLRSSQAFSQHTPAQPSTSSHSTASALSSSPSDRRRQSRVQRNRRTMPPSDSRARALEQAMLRDPRFRRQLQRDIQVHRGATRTRMVASGCAKRSLQSVNTDQLPEEEKYCTICYNNYNEESPEGIVESPLRIPKCGHVFGDHCLKKWLSESDCCPYCRSKLPAEAKLDGPSFRDFMASLSEQGLIDPTRDYEESLDELMSALSHPDSFGRFGAWPGAWSDVPGARSTAGRRPPPSDPSEDRPRTRVRVDGPNYHAPAMYSRGPNGDLTSRSEPAGGAPFALNVGQYASHRMGPSGSEEPWASISTQILQQGSQEHTSQSTGNDIRYTAANTTYPHVYTSSRPVPPAFANPLPENLAPFESQSGSQLTGSFTSGSQRGGSDMTTGRSASYRQGGTNQSSPEFHEFSTTIH